VCEKALERIAIGFVRLRALPSLNFSAQQHLEFSLLFLTHGLLLIFYVDLYYSSVTAVAAEPARDEAGATVIILHRSHREQLSNKKH
jgi:hypothetical protein